MLTSMHHDINHYANLYASELTSMHYSSIGLGLNLLHLYDVYHVDQDVLYTSVHDT